MERAEREPVLQLIPQEMREASRGSFPLSPGVMSGHYNCSRLYWYFRRDVLATETVFEVFGEQEPAPPIMEMPAGHVPRNVDGLNLSIWKDFLNNSFSARPEVDHKKEIRDLVTSNATSDNRYFEQRLNGQWSQIIGIETPPSLLRAFLYEGRFPDQNEFFDWVFAQMREQVALAQDTGFTEEWSKNLGTLFETWSKHFKEPFVPQE